MNRDQFLLEAYTEKLTTISKELMDKVWDAYWQPEPHGTQAALERVVALVLEESAYEINRLRTALEHAKPYVDAAVKSAQQRGAVSMADILVPEIVSGALRSAPDYRGEVPALQSGMIVRGVSMQGERA